jgi:NADH-quinone oxidoreductase subunit G
MADQELVTCSIDGVEVSVPKGTTILEAAKQAGVLVPHYCYHPGLPVAGVCRMCLVEVEGMPKLAIGCATTVAQGQVVRVNDSEQAKHARQGVLEFLLINHPLDCPICDQAGECELQNYVFQEGRESTRYSPTYPKRFNPVEDFGGDVLYVPNRCILCTRCVRFMEHAAGERVLNVSERGDRAFIGIHPDRDLDHPWAGNVVDLCPVGSLLSKDFLHKARAWELDHTPSVCTGCSQGCNVNLDTRAHIVVRVRPRPNQDVNRYFLCDHGRGTYRGLNRGDRLEAPLVLEGGALTAVGWDHAMARAAQVVKGSAGQAVILASASVSNEALHLAKRVLQSLRLTAVVRAAHVAGEEPLAGVPNLALREERAPNVAGAKALGYGAGFEAALGTLDGAALVLVLGEALHGVTREALDGAANVIYVGTTLPEAARGARVVLPAANVAEEDGTFVNRDGRVQRYLQAKPAPGMAQPAWWIFGELLTELGAEEPLGGADEAFERIAAEVEAFAGLSYARLGLAGAVLGAARPVEVTT